MSLMSGLFVGAGGLQTSQNALHTTAHNLSNVETNGYTRQQVYLQDRTYNNVGMASVSSMQTGLGVEYGKVRQVRDYFLDQSYRREAGRSAFYEISYETTNEIETLLGEFDGVAFQDSLGSLWTSVQELQKDPASAVTQGSLVSTSAQFIERAQAVYNGLSAYQDNLNSRVKSYVDDINALGNTIKTLNDRIMQEELGEQEANDLRDQRNAALDKLSGYVNMSYSTNADGGTEVMIEGTIFVARDRTFEMELRQDPGTGFYVPVWPQNDDQEVFDLYRAVSTDANTDIGQLKSILLSRGDRRANYTDMGTITVTEGGASKTYDIYNNGWITDKGTPDEKRYMSTSSSIIMSVQAQLDQMVHELVTGVNDYLTKENGVPDADRKYAPDAELPNELFVRLGTSRYDSDNKYVPEESDDHSNIDTLYTISNLKINAELLKTPTLLGNGFLTDDKQVDQTMADNIANLFNTADLKISPNLAQKYNFRDYYSAMVGEIATNGSVYSSIVDAQEIAVRQLDDSRQSIMGVSTNEELSNMIKYQNAYNAASRYINACNEMLENMLANLA